jgi:hypothetical protein
VVYDVTSAESFVNVKRWLHEINQNCDDVCRILGEAGPEGGEGGGPALEFLQAGDSALS